MGAESCTLAFTIRFEDTTILGGRTQWKSFLFSPSEETREYYPDRGSRVGEGHTS